MRDLKRNTMRAILAAGSAPPSVRLKYLARCIKQFHLFCSHDSNYNAEPTRQPDTWWLCDASPAPALAYCMQQLHAINTPTSPLPFVAISLAHEHLSGCCTAQLGTHVLCESFTYRFAQPLWSYGLSTMHCKTLHLTQSCFGLVSDSSRTWAMGGIWRMVNSIRAAGMHSF
jgi:hypothetical protein